VPGRGYALDLRIPYYRGLGLSMVDLNLEVDGARVPPESVRFAVHGNEYALPQLGDAVDDRWGFSEAATVTVLGEPLAAGAHEVAVVITLRVSYMPVPSVTSIRQSVELAATAA